MPRKYTKITQQIIDKVNKYLEDERGFSKKEVARLVGISDHSVDRIVRGYYDPPVEKPEATQQTDSEPQGNKHITEIPYSELEYLMKCKMFIEELFSCAVLSDKDEDELYFPRRYTNSMCMRYFPELFQETHSNLINDTYA